MGARACAVTDFWLALEHQEPERQVAVERVTRIELALSAWEAEVLPLNYTRG